MLTRKELKTVIVAPLNTNVMEEQKKNHGKMNVHAWNIYNTWSTEAIPTTEKTGENKMSFEKNKNKKYNSNTSSQTSCRNEMNTRTRNNWPNEEWVSAKNNEMQQYEA